jgi:lipoate-protein ligase A
VQLLDVTLSEPAANLALDEALLLQAEAGAGGEVLRLWEYPAPVVILGSACRIAEDVDVATCNTEGVPILRRSSGGGTVLWGPGCLLFSLVIDTERDPALETIRASYIWILEQTVAALGVPNLRVDGISDLAIGDRKISGNAQQRKRRYILHHGTLLHAFDIAGVGRFLRQPPREPEYRAGRLHTDFLTNLPLSGVELRERLITQWQAWEPYPEMPFEMIARLREEKYDQAEWTTRL